MVFLSLFCVSIVYLVTTKYMLCIADGNAINAPRIIPFGDEHFEFLGQGFCVFDEDCAKVTKNEHEMCSCEDVCKTFGECCHETSSYKEYSFTVPENMTCRPIRPHKAIWMVQNCPNSFSFPDIAEKCRSFNIGSNDPYQVIPVISVKDNIVYQNVYCAFCNDRVSDIKSANMFVTGFENECFITRKQTERAFLLQIFENKNCTVQFDIVESMSCKLEDEDKCTFSSFASKKINTQMQSFYQCNTAMESEKCIHCVIATPNKEALPKEFEEITCSKYYDSEEQALRMELYINTTNPHREAVVGKDVRCQEGALLDVLTGTCKKTFCDEIGEIYNNGYCTQMIEYIDNFQLSAVSAFWFSNYTSIEDVEYLLRFYFYPDKFPDFLNFHVRGFEIGQPFTTLNGSFLLIVTFNLIYRERLMSFYEVSNHIEGIKERLSYGEYMNVRMNSGEYIDFRILTENPLCINGSDAIMSHCRTFPEFTLPFGEIGSSTQKSENKRNTNRGNSSNTSKVSTIYLIILIIWMRVSV